MASSTTTNHYDILRVPFTATDLEIKKAFRTRALIEHPDKNGNTPESTVVFTTINNAYEILSDKSSRAQYDSVMREHLLGQYLAANRSTLMDIAFVEYLTANRSTLVDTAFAEAVVDHNVKIDALRRLDEDTKVAKAAAKLEADAKAKADAEAAAKAKADAEADAETKAKADAEAATKGTNNPNDWSSGNVHQDWAKAAEDEAAAKAAKPKTKPSNYADAAAPEEGETSPAPAAESWKPVRQKKQKQKECKYGSKCYVVDCELGSHPDGHDPRKVRPCPHGAKCFMLDCRLGFHPEGHDPIKIRGRCQYWSKCITENCTRGTHPVNHDPFAIRKPCFHGQYCNGIDDGSCTFKH